MCSNETELLKVLETLQIVLPIWKTVQMCESARNILHSTATMSMKTPLLHPIGEDTQREKSLTKNGPSADSKYFFALVLAQPVLEP